MSEGGKLQRMNPWNLISALVIGGSLGLATQFILSSKGMATFVPPYSMSVTLIALAALLIVLGVRLRRAIAKGTGAVDPFHAVRLLATSRAGQIVGALFAGFGSGLLLSLAQRSVPAHYEIWLPMLVTAITGTVLLICAVIVERMCQIPPGSTDEGDTEATKVVT